MCPSPTPSPAHARLAWREVDVSPLPPFTHPRPTPLRAVLNWQATADRVEVLTGQLHSAYQTLGLGHLGLAPLTTAEDVRHAGRLVTSAVGEVGTNVLISLAM